MNIDKGNQGRDGKDTPVIGNIANSSGHCSDTPYELKTVTGVPVAGVVRTSGEGSVWLMIGTDSGFETMTSLIFGWMKLFEKALDVSRSRP